MEPGDVYNRFQSAIKNVSVFIATYNDASPWVTHKSGSRKGQLHLRVVFTERFIMGPIAQLMRETTNDGSEKQLQLNLIRVV